MTESAKRQELNRAYQHGEDVRRGMKRPPGYDFLGSTTKGGKMYLCYKNLYRYPQYYKLEVKTEADLKGWN